MVTSSNAQHARSDGALASRPEFNIESVVKARPAMTGEDAHGFLATYAQSMALSNSDNGVRVDDPVFRYNEGEEIDAEMALVQFGRQFTVLGDMGPSARRVLWSLCRNREAQLGMPVVLARTEDASQWEADAPHVYFVEVPDALRPRLARICEAKAMTPDEVECLALVYLPADGSGWVGKDGRRRVSQLDSDVQYLLPMVAPLRKGQGEAWYHVVRACIRHLWLRANTPARDLDTVSVDDMDAAEYASFMATGGEEAF